MAIWTWLQGRVRRELSRVISDRARSQCWWGTGTEPSREAHYTPFQAGCLSVLGKPLPDGRGSVTVRVDSARFTEPRPSGSGFLPSESPKWLSTLPSPPYAIGSAD